MTPSDKTTIQVSRELQKILSSLGKKGETYDEIIRRLENETKAYFLAMIRPVLSGIGKGSGRITKANMEYLFGKDRKAN